MTNTQDNTYNGYVKKAWAIYILLTILFIAVLVLFVAKDNEEMFFYTLMPAAAAYVFRPMDKPFSRLIFKFTGLEHPSDKDQ